MYSVVPEQHLLLGCMSTTGGVLKWYRDTFCDRADPAIYKKLDAQILAQCPEPSPLIFLPYLAGERAPIWDTNAKGVLAGITCATTQAEIIRAAEEGAAFALMDNITEARASGAAAAGRCARWAARSTAGSGCRSKRPSRECRSKFRRPATVRRAVCLPC